MINPLCEICGDFAIITYKYIFQNQAVDKCSLCQRHVGVKE